MQPNLEVIHDWLPIVDRELLTRYMATIEQENKLGYLTVINGLPSKKMHLMLMNLRNIKI